MFSAPGMGNASGGRIVILMELRLRPQLPGKGFFSLSLSSQPHIHPHVAAEGCFLPVKSLRRAQVTHLHSDVKRWNHNHLKK